MSVDAPRPATAPVTRALWAAVVCMAMMLPLYWRAFERSPNLPDAL